MSPSDSDPGDAALDWEFDVTDSPLVHGAAYVFPSVLGGVALLAVGLLVWIVVTAVRTGDLARAAGLLVLAALALVTRRYLPALLGTDAVDPFWRRYSRRGLALGSLLGAAVLLGSTRLHPDAPVAVFVASWIPLVCTAAFPTTGRADPETGTLVVDGDEVPLAAVRDVRRVRLGAVVVCWLSYSRGVPSAQRIVVLPAPAVGTIERMIEGASDSSDRERSTIGRPERLVAASLGLGMAAVGPVLWLVLPPGDGRAIALYAGAMFGLFGGLLLWYAHGA